MLTFFAADCPFSHPPGRRLPGESVNKEWISPAAKAKEQASPLVDRTFGGESEATEKVLPGSGLAGRGETDGDADGDDIKVDM